MSKKRILKNSKEYRKRRISNELIEEESLKDLMLNYHKKMQTILSDKEHIKNEMIICINEIVEYFRTYDTFMLLGGIGLRLLDNLPNIEKHFISQIKGQEMNLDENSEVIAEYAMNFGLSLPNESKKVPNENVINELYQYLNDLKNAF